MKKATRYLLITCAIFCTSSLAFSQGIAYQGSPVINGEGQPIAAASVAITTANPCGTPPAYSFCNGQPQGAYSGPTPPSNLATIYTDVTIGTTRANPIFTDAFGNWTVYLVQSGSFGIYWATFYGGQLQASVQPFTVGGVIGPEAYFNSANGTVCNGLAKWDQAPGAGTAGKLTSTTGNEIFAAGVVTGNCGTSGTATFLGFGPAQVLFDSSTPAVGNAVGISISGGGLATDLGSAAPTSANGIIGTVILNPATGALPSACTVFPGCWVQLNPPGSGGSGNASKAVVTNPATTLTNTIQPPAPGIVPLTLFCPAGAAGTDICFQVQDGGGNTIVSILKNGQATFGNASAGTATINTAPQNFSTLASCVSGIEGTQAAVKDSTTNTWGATITGSGANHVLAYCDGTNWTVSAK